MPIKLHKIKITDWTGTYPAELHIPESCDDNFKKNIIHFLSSLNDHIGLGKCSKIWKLTNSEFDALSNKEDWTWEILYSKNNKD